MLREHNGKITYTTDCVQIILVVRIEFCMTSHETSIINPKTGYSNRARRRTRPRARY